MINPQCKACQFIEREGDILDWSMTNAALSLIVDCSKDSIRRHRLHSEDGELVVSSEEVGGAQWIPRRKWMSPSGEIMYSYQNANMDRSEDDAEKVDNERIDRLIGMYPALNRPAAEQSGRTAILVLADPQLGKAGEHGGGTPETIERVYNSVQRALESYRENPPAEIWLVDGGDPIENAFSTAAQIATNDRTVPEQVEDYVAVTMNVLGMLRATGAVLHHVTVTSNHGEARTAMKTNPYTSENDWGLMMQRLVADKCRDRDWAVEFHRPDDKEDTAVFDTVDGTRIAVNHGHHCGSPQQVKKWVTGQIVGQRPGHDAALFVLNHFHHFYAETLGNGKVIFGTPSIDPGSAWFTRKTGESFPPGMLGFDVSGGDWKNVTIW